MNRRTRSVLAPLFASALAWSSPSFAQDQHATAQVLFEQGKALVEQGRFAEACPKLAESLRLDPGLGTMLWLADCYENNGQTASAWAQFKDAASKAALIHDAREKVARDRTASLEARLARLQIVVPPAAAAVKGLEVKRDGIVVGSAEIGVALPVDPGVHTIGAAAPGKKGWNATVNVGSTAATTAVTIPVLEDDAEIARDPRGSEGGASTGPSEGWSAQRTVGVVVAAAGLVSFGVGTLFSFKAKSTYDGSNEQGHCVANRCDPIGLSMRDDASSQALVATVTMGVGLVAMAGGAVLFFTAPSRHSVAISPSLGRGTAGLDVRATF